MRDSQPRRLKWGLAAFFLFGALFATIGTLSVDWQFEVSLVESLTGWLPPQLFLLPEGPDVGVHMNQLAGSLLPYPLVLASLLWGFRPKSHSTLLRLGLVVLLALLFLLLFLTQSRSGWLGLGIGVVALVLMHIWWEMPRLRRGMAAIGGCLSAVFLLSAVLYTQTEDWTNLWQRPPQETLIGDLSTLDFRREVWSWGMTAVKDSPLTGIGLGTFRRTAPERYPMAIPSDFDIAHVHNIFLQVTLDTGLAGLVGYSGLVLLTAVIGWRAAGKSFVNRPLLLGLLAGLAAIHGFGLGDALAPGSKPGIILWIMVGLVVGLGKVTDVDGG
jgi:putative inorganic carbon (HCO3(-)) transporter